MSKAKKVHKHVQSWGIGHFLWMLGMFYIFNELVIHWEDVYIQIAIGLAAFWLIVHFIAKALANSTSKKTNKKP